MTRRALLMELDAAELSEWEEYWSLEPFGNDWAMTARLCLAVVNSAGLKKRSGSKWTEDDFMPAGYRPACVSDASAEEIESQLIVWAKATNASAKKSKRKK